MEAGTLNATEEEAQRLLQERLAAEAQQTSEEEEPTPSPSQLDDIEPELPHREWHFKGTYRVTLGAEMHEQEFDHTYVQKPLSYGAMMEFTGLLGRKLDQIMDGPSGLSIDEIMSSRGDGGLTLPISFQDGELTLASGDLGGGADGLVRALAKLISIMPDIIFEAQCIWLRVPRQQRPILIDIWSRPLDEGGLTHDEGDEMMNLFIDQNYAELERFFVQRASRWAKTAQKARRRMLAQQGA